MASALALFDPTYSGYLDWRSLLLALAAAALPAVHTATAAQVAAQALQMAAADGDNDGRLTQQEFEGLSWWFQPRQEMQEEALADPVQHAGLLHEVSRCMQGHCRQVVQYCLGLECRLGRHAAGITSLPTPCLRAPDASRFFACTGVLAP